MRRKIIIWNGCRITAFRWLPEMHILRFSGMGTYEIELSDEDLDNLIRMLKDEQVDRSYEGGTE